MEALPIGVHLSEQRFTAMQHSGAAEKVRETILCVAVNLWVNSHAHILSNKSRRLVLNSQSISNRVLL